MSLASCTGSFVSDEVKQSIIEGCCTLYECGGKATIKTLKLSGMDERSSTVVHLKRQTFESLLDNKCGLKKAADAIIITGEDNAIEVFLIEFGSKTHPHARDQLAGAERIVLYLIAGLAHCNPHVSTINNLKVWRILIRSESLSKTATKTTALNAYVVQIGEEYPYWFWSIPVSIDQTEIAINMNTIRRLPPCIHETTVPVSWSEMRPPIF